MPRKKGPANDNRTGGIRVLSDAQLNDIDKAIGGQLRRRRLLRGLSQRYMSHLSGLAVLQFKKYECGKDQISVALLAQFAVILDVPLSYFFANIPGLGAILPADTPLFETNSKYAAGPREALELVAAFSAIASRKTREAAFRLVAAIGIPESG